MARQILPIAGQIIGGMIGGPVGAAIGGAIGSAVGGYVDPIRHQGPKLGEARAQTAQEGVYRPLVFGTGCVAGNVIHRSPRKVVRHRESAGGKGNRDTVDSDRGYRTFAIRIAEAHTPEGYTLLRIWENEKLVYDVRPESEIPEESAEYAEKFRFYAGTQDQLPDPDLEAYLGVGNVNAYRGSSLIVFGNFDLTDYGDMVPQYRFEIASEGQSGSSLVYASYSTSLNNGIALTSSNGDIFNGSVDTGLGDEIFRMFAAGGRLYVFSAGGAGRTTANGVNFEDVSGLHESAVTGMAYGDGVWVAVHQSGGWISRSTDGVNFSLVSAPSRTRTRVAARGSTFVAGGTNRTLTVSFNGGMSWQEYDIPIDSDPPNLSIRDVINAGSAFIVTKGSNYYRSASGAKDTWTTHSLSPGQPVGGYALAANDNYAMIIGGGQTWISHDGGGSFSLAAPPPAGSGTERIAANKQGFFLPGEGGPLAYRTANGTDWASATTQGNQVNLAAADHAAMVGYGDRIKLSEVVSFCHRRVAQHPDQFDVSEISDDLDGVVFADGYTARDAIATLLPIYNADASEHDRGSGYRINYIKRGAPVVRTLTIDDLVDEPEETVREDPLERPRVLHMAFESPVTGYTAAKASIQRLSPDVKLVNEVSTYVPVTFKDVNEAWQRADVQMRVAWTEVHGERTFSISDDQLDVVPTDVLALSLRGQVQRLRVLKVEYSDGVLKLETVADRQSNYTSNVTGIPLPAPEKPPPSLMGPAAFAILDIPAISDQHDRLGYYVAVCGTTEAYAGAVIQRQQNGEWADVVRLGRSQRAIMGVLENTVSAASEHYTDTTNVVSVALYMDDDLESLSDAQWLSEGGAFALETESGWEVMQYRDAYQDSEGVWHLTHLARGRLNTAPAEHQPGSRFVLLDGVRFIDATVGMIGQPLTLRAAAVGRSPETAVPETITYQGNSQREFPVANLAAELDGSTLGMSAIPRDRFGTEQHPVRSANHDGFRWAATDGSATVTADSDHAAASLDVSGLSTPITATVSQLNRYTGAGPTVSEQVE